MLSKNNLICSLVVLLVAGLFVLFFPVKVFAGPAVPGCCITNGGQCSPSCGPAGSKCINPDLNGPGSNRCKGASVPDLFCFQVTSSTAECTSEGPGQCANDSECDDSDVCTTDTCDSGFCSNVFDEANGDSCVAPPSSTAIIPTLNQWGMIIATLILGFFAVVMLWRSKDSEI